MCGLPGSLASLDNSKNAREREFATPAIPSDGIFFRVDVLCPQRMDWECFRSPRLAGMFPLLCCKR